MNSDAVTPQKSRMMVIPFGLDGFHGSSTFARRSTKYESISTLNMIGKPRYMMTSHHLPIHQSLSPVLMKSSRKEETPWSK